MSEQLNARNINSLHEAIKADRKKIEDGQNRIETLSKQVAMYQNDLNTLRTQVAILMNRLGGGSTSGQ